METSSKQSVCRAKLAKCALPPQQHQDPRRPPHHGTCGPRGPGLGCALAVGPAPRAVGGPGVHAWGPLGRSQWPAACPLAPRPQKWRHHGKGAPQHKHRPPPVGVFAPLVDWCSPQQPILKFWGAAGCRPGKFLEFSGKFPQHACGPGCTTMGQDSPNLRALSCRWFLPPD